MPDSTHDPVSEQPFAVLDAEPGDATVFRCALCGARFTHGGRSCDGCPLHAGCDIVTCPSCGYGFPRSSTLLGWLGRLLGRGRNR